MYVSRRVTGFTRACPPLGEGKPEFLSLSQPTEGRRTLAKMMTPLAVNIVPITTGTTHADRF
jgi:hypothetical protein